MDDAGDGASLASPTKTRSSLRRRMLLHAAKLSGDRLVRNPQTGTDNDREYKFRWLLGTDGSKRRFIFFILKYLAFIYGTCVVLMQYMALGYVVLSAQRWGWLLHGKSFYLPHHTPDSMRKTSMSYRNIFFTIAQQKGFSRRDIERMLLLPTNDLLDLSPLAASTKWRPSDAEMEAANEAGLLPSPAEIDTAIKEADDARNRTTTAAAAAAAAARAAGGEGLAAAYMLQRIDASFKRVRPSEMFDAGEGQPFVRVKGGTRSLLRAAGAVTFVVFPGVISEMIEVGPFGDLPIWGDSTMATLWRERLAYCSTVDPSDTCHGGAAGACDVEGHLLCDRSDTVDKRFFLDDLEVKPDSMEALVSVGSIDATEGDMSGAPPGTPLVKIVRLNAIMGSLETVGTIERTATAYVRRLAKVFALLGAHMENTHFLGYSRGASVALHVLAITKRKDGAAADDTLTRYAWTRHVKGLVSLGGVLFGTEAADTIYYAGHVHRDLTRLLTNTVEMADYSQEGDFGSIAHAREVAANTKLFMDMSVELAQIMSRKVTAKEMTAEFAELGAPSPDYIKTAKMLIKFLFNTFHLREAVSEYYENIKKFKVVVNHLRDAVVELTTYERVRWWSQHVIPVDNFQYYSVGATMGDPRSLHAKRQADASFNILKLSDSADFQALRAFYYDLVTDSFGKQLNDGQVCVDRAILWPSLVKALNPAQPDFRATFLGIHGGHHWNLALPNVFDGSTDPFPRGVMVEAIATFIAQDLALPR